MAEKKKLIINQDAGKVIVSNDVIRVITQHAVDEVEGSAGLSNTGKTNWRRSITLYIGDNNALAVECSINVIYGYNIVATAAAVRKAIARTINSMTGIKVKAVYVNVSGIIRK